MKRIIIYVVSLLAVGGGITIIVYAKLIPSLTEGSSSVMAGLSFIVIGLLLVFLAE